MSTSVPLKELRSDILSHFMDDLNYGLSVGKPKKNTKGVILKQKETSMTEDGEDWSGLKNNDFEKFS